jgi:hypothetical protein
MILLSVCTSVAFNYAAVTTERKDDVRLHARRKALLKEAKEWVEGKRIRGTRCAEMSLQEAEQEQRLAMRLFKLGLDPLKVGLNTSLVAEALAHVESAGHGLSQSSDETTWGEVFFGKSGKIKGSMQKAVANAGKSFESWRMGDGAQGEGSSALERRQGEDSLTQPGKDDDWREWELGESTLSR